MAVYSLGAETETEPGRAFQVIATDTPHGKGKTLTRDDFHVGQDDGQVKESARQGGLAAFQYLRKKGLVHHNSEIPECNFTFDFEAAPPNLIKGPSAVLCFSIKMGQLIIEDCLAMQGQTYASCDVTATGILHSANSAGKAAFVNYLDAKIKAACQAMGQGGMSFTQKPTRTRCL